MKAIDTLGLCASFRWTGIRDWEKRRYARLSIATTEGAGMANRDCVAKLGLVLQVFIERGSNQSNKGTPALSDEHMMPVDGNKRTRTYPSSWRMHSSRRETGVAWRSAICARSTSK